MEDKANTFDEKEMQAQCDSEWFSLFSTCNKKQGATKHSNMQ